MTATLRTVLLVLFFAPVLPGCMRAEAAGRVVLPDVSPTEHSVVRPSLDEQLEEWRSACDHLAGNALQVCLAPAGSAASDEDAEHDVDGHDAEREAGLSE